jgi:hypothetical protein
MLGGGQNGLILFLNQGDCPRVAPPQKNGELKMIGTGDNGETIIYLGEGDVLISTGRHPEQQFENEVIFSQDEAAHPIGEYTERHAGELSTVLNNPVRLQFLKAESIDVLMERLEKVRASMSQASKSPDAGSGESIHRKA